MFEWSDLRHFLAIARKGSTLRAAKALGVSQSTVHRRIVALERCLGRRLVLRRPTGYRLTDLREEMRSPAERVEASVTEFQRHAASRDPDLVTTVRVACAATAAQRLIGSS